MMKIVVGAGSCGIAAGAQKVYDALESLLPENAALSVTGCNGMCFAEPIVDLYDENGALTRLTRVGEADAPRIAEAVKNNDLAAIADLKISDDDAQFLEKQTRIALRHCGVINPESIEEYENAGGYTAIRRALFDMTPETVIDRKSTRLNSSHRLTSRMPSSA